MPLSGDELIELQEAILKSFSNKESVEALAVRVKGVSLDRLALGDRLDTIVQRMIMVAQDEDWLTALLQGAAELRPAESIFPQFLQKFQSSLTLLSGDHYDVPWVAKSRALVNRTALRNGLRTLNTSHGKKILIVDGDARSGNSYSLRLIHYLEAELKTFRVVPIDLERLATVQPSKQIFPRTLGQSIADRMNLGVMPEENGTSSQRRTPNETPQQDREQAARWAQRFIDWFGGKIHDLLVPHWLVLDSFSKVVLPESTRVFIEWIAHEIDMNWEHMRLVLLSYRDKDRLPSHITPSIEYEQIATIGTDDLVPFFIHLYEMRKQRQLTGYAADNITNSVASVLRQVDLHHQRRLEMLSAAIVNEASVQRLI